MKSEDISVQQLFQDRRQFMVPFYQRAYVWNRKNQWEPLWEDICAKAEARLMNGRTTPHFLGAVVLDPQPQKGLIGVNTLHIIDGQQRLATLQFVLKAVLMAMQSSGAGPIGSIVQGALVNSNPDTMRYPDVEIYKVWPTFRDREDFKKALRANDLDELRKKFPGSFTQSGGLRKVGTQHPPPLEAIWYFSECIREWISTQGDGDVAARCEALASSILQDLKIVSITLDEDDDAQVIFETLNGRGARLHATDLIRNFIFMRADHEEADSKQLYESMWQGFENDYWGETQRRGRILKPRLEWFIHATLQAELCEEVDLGRLYFEYRRWVARETQWKSARGQLEVLSNHSSHYREMVDGSGERPIGRFGRRIAQFDITTLHPLALMISTSQVPEDTKNQMLDMLFSYVVRRAICGLTPKNYNKIFFSILNSLVKSGVSLQVLRESFAALKGDTTRWPTDAEFRNACLNGPLYPGRLDAPRMRAILTELEWGLRKDARTEDSFGTNCAHLDIDHILPQSWYEHWALPDGSMVDSAEADAVFYKTVGGAILSDREAIIAERQQALRTLGNLTLLHLSVNREAQNKTFNVKRDLLIKNTSLMLNTRLLDRTEWNELGIRRRSEELADLALSIWPGLGLEPEPDPAPAVLVGEDAMPNNNSETKAQDIDALKAAAEKGDADAQYDLGLHYSDIKDYETAFRWYSKAADSGHVQAQGILATMYEDGIGVAADQAKAIEFYLKAADGDDAGSLLRLGEIYESGEGVEKDPVVADQWFRKAAAQYQKLAEDNDDDAQYALGSMIERGQGMPVDKAQAMAWYVKAGENGNADAQYLLGLNYCIENNYAATLTWYRKAAEQGHAEAQYMLGSFLEDEGGRNPDTASALTWYQKAAAQGEPNALKRLGKMYSAGQYLPFDMEKAEECYRKAVEKYRELAEDGDFRAQYELGLMLANGKGTAKNVQEAAGWLIKAAEQDDENAQFVLAGMYADGRGVSRDLTKAMEWRRKAAALGHEEAKASLRMSETE